MLIQALPLQRGPQGGGDSDERSDLPSRARAGAAVERPIGQPRRPARGSRNKATLAAAALLAAGRSEGVDAQKAVEMALDGDPWTFSPRA